MSDELTDREAAVCELLTAGKSAKEVGLVLGISHRTVETHKERVFKKLGVDNIVKLTRVVMRREIGKDDHV